MAKATKKLYDYPLVNIIQIRACNLTAPFRIDPNKAGRLYKGTVSRSLFLMHLMEAHPGEFRTETNKNGKEKAYTDAIITVSFNHSERELLDDGDGGKTYGKTLTNKSALTRKLTKDGFAVIGLDGKETRYVMLGRGSSMARGGKEVFVKEALHEGLKKWLDVGMEFGLVEEIDYSSYEAYRFLNESSIVGTVGVKPNEVLLINDELGHPSIRKTVSYATVDGGGKLQAKPTEVQRKPLIWDGQALADSSLFARATLFGGEGNPLAEKGMMLLRNHWFKSCAFHCHIQEYIKDVFARQEWHKTDGNDSYIKEGAKTPIPKDRIKKIADDFLKSAEKPAEAFVSEEPDMPEYIVETRDDIPEYINDMFGRKIKTTDIKLIVTPSSVKFLKLWYKFEPGLEELKEYFSSGKHTVRETEEKVAFLQKKACYEYWLDHLLPDFGICKAEKKSEGACQKGGYQFWNTLPLAREEMADLASYETEYVEKIQNNVKDFKKHLGIYGEAATNRFITDALSVREDVWRTQLCKKFNTDVVAAYKKRLYKGKIRVPDSANCYMCGNPYEMLQYAVFGNFVDYPLGASGFYGERVVWCSNFPDNTPLALFRSPHIAEGNVYTATNRQDALYRNRYFKYFNVADNIIYVNGYDNYLQDRLQGADYDSDFCFVTANKTIVEAAKKCDGALTPVNGIKPIKQGKKKWTDTMKANTNFAIANNKIGIITNWGQLLTSYKQHFRHSNADGENDALIGEIGEHESILSSLSQCEIDKAKGAFAVSVRDYIGGLKKLPFVEKEESFKYEKNKRGKKYKRELRELENKLAACQDEEERADIAKQIETLHIGAKKDPQVIYPMFFKHILKGKHPHKYFETPMDYLYKTISELPEREWKKGETIEICELVAKPDFKLRNKKQLEKFESICAEAKKGIKAVKSDKDIDWKAAKERKREIVDGAVAELAKIKFNGNTMHVIVYKLFTPKPRNGGKPPQWYDKRYYGMRMLALGLLHKAHKETLIDCFRE